MKAVGLIVEYNPLHNGHLHHIEQARLKSNAEIVIAVMSGNFLQRGEPAIVDKFTRARMALEQQVDLVIELPTVYTIQHSDIFAHGAIRLLNELQVEEIIFGSEQGDISAFHHTWRQIEANQTNYQSELKKRLQQGYSYPMANNLVLNDLDIATDLDLRLPNNILGLGYLKAQKKVNPKIKLNTIKRIQADYHQSNLSFPITSATSIRNQIKGSLDSETYQTLAMPLSSFQLLSAYWQQAKTFHDWEAYFPLLKYRVISDSVEQLRAINGMIEGLEYRLKSKIHQANTFVEFIDQVQTKRYTKTRLQRLCVHLLLQLTKDRVSEQLNLIDQVKEIRLLAMSRNGQAYLNQLKQTTELTFITQLRRNLSHTLQIDEKSAFIYYLAIKSDQQFLFRQREFKPPFKMHTD